MEWAKGAETGAAHGDLECGSWGRVQTLAAVAETKLCPGPYLSTPHSY